MIVCVQQRTFLIVTQLASTAYVRNTYVMVDVFEFYH